MHDISFLRRTEKSVSSETPFKIYVHIWTYMDIYGLVQMFIRIQSILENRAIKPIGADFYI